MINKTLTLVGLTLSLTANAAIVDMGNITRDTATGLDWLDLTETNGRSFNDISSKLGASQEFDGWRYATADEVQTLWNNLGMPSGTYDSVQQTDIQQYQDFITASNLLGSTYNQYNSVVFDYGMSGMSENSNGSGQRYLFGMTHYIGNTNTSTINRAVDESRVAGWSGSYLVQPAAVPVPAAAWLFGSALVGLAGIGRKRPE